MTWNKEIISQTFYESIIDNISNTVWLTNHWSEIFLFILAIYAILIIIFWAIHNTIKNNFKKNKEKYFLECDNIIYQLAKEQYQNKYSENINISLLESIFSSNTKSYFSEKYLFEKKIKEIENITWKSIINQNQRASFYKYYKKTKSSKISSQIIWWILTIFTMWIYRLFM